MRIAKVIILITLFCFPAVAAPVVAVPAKTVTDTFGVNTHLGELDYTLAGTKTELAYVPFGHVRDQVLLVSYLQIYQQLYTDTGVKLTDAVNPTYGDSYASQLAYLLAHQSSIRFIEGPNEPNSFPITWNALTGIPAISSFQYQLARDFSSACIKVAGPSDNVYGDATALATLPGNYFNIHPYVQFDYTAPNSTYPLGDIQQLVANISIMMSGKPPLVTESGGWTVPMASGETQTVQAKYNMDYLFDGYISGAGETDLYELQDNTCDPSGTNAEFHFGQFNCDGTTKTSAVTLHNMFSLLSDSATSFTAGSLNYSLAGMPAQGQRLLMQKSDGTYWLALWNDVQIWNYVTFQEIVVSPVSVTLSLTPSASVVNVYDPLIGTSIQQTASNVSSIAIQVPDHVILVNIIP